MRRMEPEGARHSERGKRRLLLTLIRKVGQERRREGYQGIRRDVIAALIRESRVAGEETGRERQGAE